MPTIKQEFIHFLKQHKAYECFIYYASKYKLNIKNNPNPMAMLTVNATKQGNEYWWKLSKKWYTYINGKIFIPLFMNFLIENNLYQKYIAHIKGIFYLSFKNYYDLNLEKYLLEQPPSSFIEPSYFVDDFIECEMWKKISNEWEKCYIKKYDTNI